MQRTVLKPFYYAADGVNAKRMVVGRSHEFHDEDIPNLEDQDLIEKSLPPVRVASKRKRKS